MDTSHKLILQVQGMCCPEEVKVLRKALEGKAGVQDAMVDLLQHKLIVEYKPELVDKDDIVLALSQTGMGIQEIQVHAQAPEVEESESKIPVILSGMMMALAFICEWIAPSEAVVNAFYAGAILAGGWALAPEVWNSLRRFRLDMNVLMMVAVFGAMGLGEFVEAASITFLFALSEWMEHFSLALAQRSIRSLMVLTPETALVVQGGQDIPTPVEQVKVGETIRVRPGERVPLDGEVIRGRSFLNEAAITGESVPVGKEAGSAVYAGTMNQDGSLEIRVEKVSSESILAKVKQLIEQSRAKRSPTERFVDQFARYYTPTAMILALLLATVPPLLFSAPWGEWFYRSLVLLVISCPCALVISTPVSVVSALASAARNGVLIKGGAYLEAIGKAKVFAFDKTGTLTEGSPNVTEVIPFNRRDKEDIVGIAASISKHSQHPLSQAICSYAEEKNIAVPEAQGFNSLPGRGVTAEVEGTRFLMGNHRLFEEHDLCHDDLHECLEKYDDDHRIAIGIGSHEQAVGSILMMDTLRNHTPEAIAELKAAGIDTVYMLTGDNAGTAQHVAQQAGVTHPLAELLPEDKVRIIQDLMEKEKHIVMVGDGVNDAPALAAASVGIAMGAMGSDVALESAPVALMSEDLRKIPWLLRHSRRLARVIRWNIFLALFIKLFFMALAIPGWATLWMAVIADTGASLLVTANGLRMLRIRP